MNLKDDPAHQAAHEAALRRAGHVPPDAAEKKDAKMFAGSTIGTVDDFDRVLKILELVDDDPKRTKGKVEHTRKLAVEFERLAKEQTEFAKQREEHRMLAAA